MLLSPCLIGGQKAGATLTIREAGSNGIVGIIWEGAVPMMSAK
jgi:hypothetical protein